MHPLTLPNIVCKTCTLQVLQIMTRQRGRDLPALRRHRADDWTGRPADGGAGARDGAAVRVTVAAASMLRLPLVQTPAWRRSTAAAVPVAPAAAAAVAAGGSASGGSAPMAGSGGSGGSGGRGGSPAPAPAPAPAPPPEESSGFCSIGGGDQKTTYALALVVLVGGLVQRARRRNRR